MFIYLPLHVAAKFYSHHHIVYKSIHRNYTEGEASPLKAVNMLL